MIRTPEDTVSREAVAVHPAGFTLVEMLIGMVLGLMLVGGSLTVFDSVRQSSRVEGLRVHLQQNARYALDLVVRDVMEAGQEIDPTSRFGVVAVGDGGALPDTLYVLTISPGMKPHVVKKPPANEEKSKVVLKITCVDPIDDLEVGSFLHLSSGTARGIALIEGMVRTESSALKDDCGNPSPPGEIGELELSVTTADGEGHGWIFEGNVENAVGWKADPSVYYVDEGSSSKRLMRATDYSAGEWRGVPLSEGVSDLQLEYVFTGGATGIEASGTDADEDNDYDDVDSVSIVLTVEAVRRDKDLAGGGTYERSYATRATPRNNIYTRNLE